MGETPRLFQIYAAGNFIEASLRSCFLQIGETKYGKPILDRALTPDCPLDQAAKLALLSFDATLRSNLSCGMPIDILRYETDSFSANNLAMLKEDDPYWNSLRNAYGEGLSGLVKMLPPPPSWSSLGASFLRALNAVRDQLAGFRSIAPADDLDPFAGLKILVVGEEVLDLLEGDLRQVAVIGDGVEALGDMGRRHRHDLLVHAGIVLHQQNAHGTHAHHRARHDGAGIGDQHIHRIAVTGKVCGMKP